MTEPAAATGPLRVLHLEDSAADAELVRALLEADGLVCVVQRVETRPQFLAALEDPELGIILSDYSIPSFDGLAALADARARRPEVPFLFVSGTLGEERAVEALRGGATDFIVKDRLSRLGPAVRRALEEAKERAARKQAEDKIVEQSALLDGADEAIMVEDLEGRLSYWNGGAEKLYGYSSSDAVGRDAAQLLQPGNSRPMQQARELAKDRGAWTGLLRQRRRDGAELVVQSRLALVRDPAGAPRSLLVINDDVTEVKRLEAKFLRAQRMESIGALAGGIAHDLNNVLSPILMAVDMLARKLRDEQSRRILNALETSARRGAEMVAQVLAFARGVQDERVALQPTHLLREMEKILRETLPRSIQVAVSAPSATWAVSGQPTRLHQVLMNLCVNARDAMLEGGQLSLESDNVTVDAAAVAGHPGAAPGEYVKLTVSDTGAGIPADVLARVFEPFFTTKGEKGTGLGLSTARSIVEEHGGFMEVASAPGAGTTFKVYIPAVRMADTKAPEAGAAELPLGSGQLVLVVDDEAAIREIARETLEAHGYRVLSAADGDEAIAVSRQHPGELAAVVTDLVMPARGGLATIGALREMRPDLPIVGTSGALDPEAVEKVASLVEEFLPKPFTARRLLETLDRVLRKARGAEGRGGSAPGA